MRRSWLIWIGFAGCLAAVIVAMVWLSLAAVRLDRAEAEARRQADEAARRADLEGKIRLALWRLDSTTLAPLVVQESVLPWFAYRSFFPADRAYSHLFNPRREGEILIPSPLLTPPPAPVLVHFQFEPDGELTSPQVPTATNRKLAVPRHVSDEAVAKARAQLARVGRLVSRKDLLAVLKEHKLEPVQVVMSPPPQPPRPASQTMLSQTPPNPSQAAQGQQFQSPLRQTKEERVAQRNRRVEQQRDNQDVVEYNIRNDWLNSATINGTNVYGNWGQAAQSGNLFWNGSVLQLDGSVLPTDMSGVPMKALWIGGELLLARRVSAGGREYIQGCLLDWPAMKTALVDTVADLLPNADFEPFLGEPGPNDTGLLAALPIRLLPGALAGGEESRDAGLSPILLALALAWACMATAALAVAGVLAGVMRLSERRASFVSAVTHELRTPLTTFQMYAEMLAEGMVDEAGRQRYLNTLRAEAVRLTHLVENVLSYARLERNRADGRLEAVTLGQLVDGVKGRLAGRAEQAGMELVFEGDEADRQTVVRANVSAVEQVLFNLVDNACKYAATADDRRIHVALQGGDGQGRISVCDHGPGLSPTFRRRLFRSFSKSAREAAHSAPGIGLGLALSRRLARNMGGDLRLEDRGGAGACFVLTLGMG